MGRKRKLVAKKGDASRKKKKTEKKVSKLIA